MTKYFSKIKKFYIFFNNSRNILANAVYIIGILDRIYRCTLSSALKKYINITFYGLKFQENLHIIIWLPDMMVRFKTKISQILGVFGLSPRFKGNVTY